MYHVYNTGSGAIEYTVETLEEAGQLIADYDQRSVWVEQDGDGWFFVCQRPHRGDVKCNTRVGGWSEREAWEKAATCGWFGLDCAPVGHEMFQDSDA
jgi:hypothetical protein